MFFVFVQDYCNNNTAPVIDLTESEKRTQIEEEEKRTRIGEEGQRETETTKRINESIGGKKTKSRKSRKPRKPRKSRKSRKLRK